jgi:hypothetical protein
MVSRLDALFRLPLAITTAVVWFAPPATTQELRLKDGRILVGEYRERDGNYVVDTREGEVVVTKEAVGTLTEKLELIQKLSERARNSDDSAFASLQLADQAHDYGLEREMWRHLDRAFEQLPEVVAERPDHPVERQLRDFLAQLEPELLPRELRQAPTATRVKRLLRQLLSNTGEGKRAAIEELLVREPNADQDLRQEARRNPNTRQRIGALAALQRRTLAGNDRFVLRTAVLDRSKDVREAAVTIARPHADVDDVTYMASGLAHGHPKVRIRTAEALGNLGHAGAVDLLVKAGPLAASGLAAGFGGNGVRGNVAFLQQQAYIRDYDVEVAQAAFIADPKIDVLQSGSVLDVTVGGMFEVRTIVRAYRSALKQLTSFDPGTDPRNWPTWSEKLPEPAPAATTEKR